MYGVWEGVKREQVYGVKTRGGQEEGEGLWGKDYKRTDRESRCMG